MVEMGLLWRFERFFISDVLLIICEDELENLIFGRYLLFFFDIINVGNSVVKLIYEDMFLL